MGCVSILKFFALSISLSLSRSDNSLFPQGKDMIIVFSMPKSGTTSLNNFFNGSGYRTVHFLFSCDDLVYPVPKVTLKNTTWKQWTLHDVGPVLTRLYDKGRGVCPAGLYVQQALVEKKDPFHYFLKKGHRVIIETNFRGYGKSDRAIYPQIDALDNILDAYPQATYVVYQRNITNHISSLMAWSHSTFVTNLRLSHYVPRSVSSESNANVIRYFIESYYENTLNKLRSKGIPFIHADVEDEESLYMLKSKLGIHNDMFVGHDKSNTPHWPS
mmetsp:Transcript_22497/g.32852  ORF Transcript_22497/g.32852 Transcript_22497/m.32852 type:complete len:272 (+) Transcript_22497:98-913(+)